MFEVGQRGLVGDVFKYDRRSRIRDARRASRGIVDRRAGGQRRPAVQASAADFAPEQTPLRQAVLARTTWRICLALPGETFSKGSSYFAKPD